MNENIRRVKASALALEQEIIMESKKDRIGTIIPWKNPDFHHDILMVLWDGRKSHATYHVKFLDIIE